MKRGGVELGVICSTLVVANQQQHDHHHRWRRGREVPPQPHTHPAPVPLISPHLSLIIMANHPHASSPFFPSLCCCCIGWRCCAPLPAFPNFKVRSVTAFFASPLSFVPSSVATPFPWVFVGILSLGRFSFSFSFFSTSTCIDLNEIIKSLLN